MIQPCLITDGIVDTIEKNKKRTYRIQINRKDNRLPVTGDLPYYLSLVQINDNVIVLEFQTTNPNIRVVGPMEMAT